MRDERIKAARALLWEHQYRAAVDAYRHVLLEDSGRGSAMEGLGFSLLSLGEYAEAAGVFEEANRVCWAGAPATYSQPYILEAGAAWYLAGDLGRARKAFQDKAASLRSDEITYAPAAVRAVLLQWFLEVRVGDSGVASRVLALLGECARGGFPLALDEMGSLALVALGLRGWGEVLLQFIEVRDLETAIAAARADLFVRRELTPLLFYRGVTALARGARDDYRIDMATCASLENPILELEWYLARHESGAADS